MLVRTATPVQLNRQETINVLNVSDDMEGSLGRHRVEVLQSLRARLATKMLSSAEAGKAFSREWGSLAEQFSLVGPAYETGQLTFQDGKYPRTARPRTPWMKKSPAAMTS